MLVRESIFMVIAVFVLWLSIDSLRGLKKSRVAASRIFLRDEEVLKAFKSLLTGAVFAVLGSITLFLWSIARLEILRLVTAIFLIFFASFILSFCYSLRRVITG